MISKIPEEDQGDFEIFNQKVAAAVKDFIMPASMVQVFLAQNDKEFYTYVKAGQLGDHSEENMSSLTSFLMKNTSNLISKENSNERNKVPRHTLDSEFDGFNNTKHNIPYTIDDISSIEAGTDLNRATGLAQNPILVTNNNLGETNGDNSFLDLGQKNSPLKLYDVNDSQNKNLQKSNSHHNIHG